MGDPLLASVRITRASGSALAGSFDPPGDKSITHRAILFGLLAEGETVVTGANAGGDVESSLAVARALGAEVTRTPERLVIRGRALALREPEAPLDCGNSGTTLRLAAGAIAGQPIFAVLFGDDSLNQRPVARIIEPLRRMGAQLHARAGDRLPPLAVRGGTLAGIRYDVPVASAQVATCVLMAGLTASGTTGVTLPGPARDHTERLLPAFGIECPSEALPGGGRRVSVAGGQRPRGTRVEVPGDFSAAAFLLAAAAATPGARVTARAVNLNPTRTALLDVLERMGAKVEHAHVREVAGESRGDVTVTGPEALAACDIPPEWIPRLIDEIPAWCIAAACARGVSRLTGAAELRVKESDRLSTLARGLTALGVAVREREDGLEITGGAVRGGTVATAGDHRIAMAFAALAARADGAIVLDDPSPVATSYPAFFADLTRLGFRVEPAAAMPAHVTGAA